MTSPRIYVASLSDYNAGTLHGAWIDLAGKTADDVNEEIEAMLAKSPEALNCFMCGKFETSHGDEDGQEPHDFVAGVAEEWAIHDSDGFGTINIGEYEDLDVVVEMAQLIIDHDDAAIVWLADNASEHVVNLEEAFNDAYLGDYDDAEDYARSYVEDTGMLADVPDTIAQYFNYEAFGRDMVLGGDISIIDGHVFSNNI